MRCVPTEKLSATCCTGLVKQSLYFGSRPLSHKGVQGPYRESTTHVGSHAALTQRRLRRGFA